MITIITCTNKPGFIHNVFQNYANQDWRNKELIVVLNKDEMRISKWKKRADKYSYVSIYQLPEEKTLGDCYNFALDQAKGEFVATFDDDDYYGPYYLSSLMHKFDQVDADIVGKASYYAYIESINALVIRHPGKANRYVMHLDGGKRLIKRNVFNKVRFRSVTVAEDTWFSKDCLEHGFKIYSADRFHHIYMRSANSSNNTYKVKKDENFIRKCSKNVEFEGDYKAFVDNISKLKWQAQKNRFFSASPEGGKG